MKSKVLLEGILLFLLAFVSLVEGLYLMGMESSQKVRDVLGPGFYLVLLSSVLVITSIVHLANFRKQIVTAKSTMSRETGMRVVSIMAVLSIYTFLIGTIGYLFASLIFFLMLFKVVGIKSWRTAVFATLLLTGFYYLVFVQLCNMIFPPGIIFGKA